MKKLFIGTCLVYSVGLFLLLILNFKNEPNAKAMMLMGLFHLILWVGLGGYLERRSLQKNYEKLTTPKTHPVLSFALFATALACVEELIATTLTNLAPVFGGVAGQAFITASTNYFHVIFFHSVIVFVPMFFMLGYILRKYDISPFAAFFLFGIIGIVAEMSLAGPQALLNAPFWIMVYGLMVYLPAHSLTRLERKRPNPLLYPLFIILILVSSIAAVWFPLLFDTGNHYL